MTLSGCKHGFEFHCVCVCERSGHALHSWWHTVMRSLSLDPDQHSRSLASSPKEQVLLVAASGFPVRLPPVSLPDREGFRKLHSQYFSTSQKLKGRASFGPCFFPVVFGALPPPFLPLSLSLVGLSSYVPWASLFLWPYDMTLKLWRHDWEDIREDVALREERWQNAQNFLRSFKVCICVYLSHLKNYS